MCREFGLEPIGEWWFGTDIVDLLRHIQITLAAKTETAALADEWRNMFAKLVDGMQLEIDCQRQSSEVHMVLKKQS